MYQLSTYKPITNKIFLYYHGNDEDIFKATTNDSVIKHHCHLIQFVWNIQVIQYIMNQKAQRQ